MSELRMSRLHALSLLDFAEEQGLGETCRDALNLLQSGKPDAKDAPEGLREFLAPIPGGELEDVLRTFLDMARRKMERVPVEIISAVPLTEQQLFKLEVKLIRLTKKQLDITTTVDPSLLGGVRVLVENTVIDESLKRKLTDMKLAVYKGVYLR